MQLGQGILWDWRKEEHGLKKVEWVWFGRNGGDRLKEYNLK